MTTGTDDRSLEDNPFGAATADQAAADCWAREPARPDRSRVLVRTPDGGLYDVADPRLAAELGTGLRVMRLDRGAFDAMPVSVISRSTVSALSTLARVLKVIGATRRARAGVYGTTVVPGLIRVGDPVVVERPPRV